MTCAKFRCDQLRIFQTIALQIFYQILNSVETLFMEWVPARVIGKFNDNDGIINHKTLNGTKV